MTSERNDATVSVHIVTLRWRQARRAPMQVRVARRLGGAQDVRFAVRSHVGWRRSPADQSHAVVASDNRGGGVGIVRRRDSGAPLGRHVVAEDRRCVVCIVGAAAVEGNVQRFCRVRLASRFADVPIRHACTLSLWPSNADVARFAYGPTDVHGPLQCHARARGVDSLR